MLPLATPSLFKDLGPNPTGGRGSWYRQAIGWLRAPRTTPGVVSDPVGGGGGPGGGVGVPGTSPWYSEYNCHVSCQRTGVGAVSHRPVFKSGLLRLVPSFQLLRHSVADLLAPAAAPTTCYCCCLGLDIEGVLLGPQSHTREHHWHFFFGLGCLSF